MNPLKRLLKSTATSIASRYGLHHRALAQPHLWVLMYHRILPADDPRFAAEEPGMVVTPETFDMHLREAKKYFEILSLKEWVQLKQTTTQLPRKACVITFDDGWLDNFQFALPILKQHAVPATLFAVAEKIGTDFQFWPNIILWLLFNGRLSALQTHPLFGNSITNKNPVLNREFAASCILKLKQFSDKEIFTALEEVNQGNNILSDMPRALMNWDELKFMQQSGLIDVGSHTCNHKRLTDRLTTAELQHEITSSKAILENQLNQKIDLFCFPNGDYNQAALALVKSTYAAAVTTQKGIVSNNNFSLHELKRIGLHEQVSRTPRDFGARLSGMM
jgi:peptidoglycan/xylan/chitin deacetylase (PgdA/CDA1 family)